MNFYLLFLFILSALFLFIVGWLLSKVFSDNIYDTFWITLGSMYLQISTITLFLSIFRKLNFNFFLIIQFILVLILFTTFHYKNFTNDLKFSRQNSFDLDRVEKFLILVILILLGISFLKRIITPLSHGDVLYYHASRVLYWLQNSSIEAYPTMNDRQTVFAFGSDLIFMWPVMFVKSEFISRMIYWLGYPLSAIGFFTILKSLQFNKKWNLFGIIIFISTPIVYTYSNTLEPLIWVTFFSLGTVYFAIRIFQTKALNKKFIFCLGLFSVLPGNIKNYGMVFIPSGILLLLYLFKLNKHQNKKTKIVDLFEDIKIYIIAIVICLLISGLGFLMVQNLVLYGNLFSSNLRANQNIADFSLQQFYVHTIRGSAVFMEIPMPIFDNKMENAGQYIIQNIGANKYLPKEKEWGWVGHYEYSVFDWPPEKDFNESFGFVGFFIFFTIIITIIKLIINKGKYNFVHIKEKLFSSPIISYMIMSLPLFIGPLYILRWITCGTRSFLTPGVILLIPIGLYLFKKVINHRILTTFLITLFLIYMSLFIPYQYNILNNRFNYKEFNWSKISYTQSYRYELIENHVPLDGELIVLVHSNFKDYTLFGKNYNRKIYQFTNNLNKNNIKKIKTDHSNAYLYIIKRRYQDNLKVLDNFSGISLIKETNGAKLYKFN